MNVENKLRIYEIDGKETKVGNNKDLSVRSVWNRDRFVELQIGENGEKVLVYSADLIKAISNSILNENP